MMRLKENLLVNQQTFFLAYASIIEAVHNHYGANIVMTLTLTA